jgi:hypothetical protein
LEVTSDESNRDSMRFHPGLITKNLLHWFAFSGITRNFQLATFN